MSTSRPCAAAAVEFDAAVAELPVAGALARRPACRARRPPIWLPCCAMIDRSGVALAVLDETRSARWHQATDALTAQIAAFAAATHPGLDVATPAAIDLPLADLQAQAQAAAAVQLVRAQEAADRGARPARGRAAARRRGRTRRTFRTWSPRCCRFRATVRGLAAQAGAIPGRLRPGRLEPADRAGSRSAATGRSSGCAGRAPRWTRRHRPPDSPRPCGAGWPPRNPLSARDRQAVLRAQIGAGRPD